MPYPNPLQVPIVHPTFGPKGTHVSPTGVAAVHTTPARYQPRGASAATHPDSRPAITPTPPSLSGSNADEVRKDVPGASTDAPPLPASQRPLSVVSMYYSTRVEESPPPVSAVAPPSHVSTQADKMQHKMQPSTPLPQRPLKFGTQAMPGNRPRSSADTPGASTDYPGASTDYPGASTDASPQPSSLYISVVPSYQHMRDGVHSPPQGSKNPTPQFTSSLRPFSAYPASTQPRPPTSSSHTKGFRSKILTFRSRASTPSGHAADNRELVSAKFKVYSNAGFMDLDALCRFRRDQENHIQKPESRAATDSKSPCADCDRILKMYSCDARGMVSRDFVNFCAKNVTSLDADQSSFYSKAICLKLSCRALKKMDLFSESDSYAVVKYRTSDVGRWEHAAQSQVQKNEANPIFEELKFSIFGNSDMELDEAQICIQILDHDRFSKDDPIGRLFTTPTGLARLKEGGEMKLEGYGKEAQRSSNPFVGFIKVDDFKHHPATPLS